MLVADNLPAACVRWGHINQIEQIKFFIQVGVADRWIVVSLLMVYLLLNNGCQWVHVALGLIICVTNFRSDYAYDNY